MTSPDARGVCRLPGRTRGPFQLGRWGHGEAAKGSGIKLKINPAETNITTIINNKINIDVTAATEAAAIATMTSKEMVVSLEKLEELGMKEE